MVWDRNGPIGADGLLISSKTPQGSKMDMYNVDGSPAEMCGNGMRCVARQLLKQDSSQITIMNAVGPVRWRLAPDIYPGVKSVAIHIGPVNIVSSRVPMITGAHIFSEEQILQLGCELLWSAVSIPNPHLITFTENITSEQLEVLGMRAAALTEVFPNGINVSVVEIKSQQWLYVRTYERGCGFTQACGTAMCASAYLACTSGRWYYGSQIRVQSPGGFQLWKISGPDSDTVEMIGNATWILSGALTLRGNGHISVEVVKVYEDEEFSYKKMMHTNY